MFYKNVDLSDLGEVHQYVIEFEEDDLLEIIKDHYLLIKNNCAYAPCLGENGCIEFAAALLYHMYIIDELEKERYGLSKHSVNVLLDELVKVSLIICSAYTGIKPMDFSNMTDIFSENTTLITRKEFSVIYLYLRDYFGEKIRGMEFNEGNGVSTDYVSWNYERLLKDCQGNIETMRSFFLEIGLHT